MHIYLVFVHNFWLTAPKNLRISLVTRAIKVSCWVNDMTSGSQLTLGTVFQKINHVIRGLEL